MRAYAFGEGNLVDGHRVIHGVAGSGKTMILGYRCVYLAQTSSKPILVLCYNTSLAGRLKQVLETRCLSDKVSVSEFTHKCNAHPCIDFVRRLPAQAFAWT